MHVTTLILIFQHYLSWKSAGTAFSTYQMFFDTKAHCTVTVAGSIPQNKSTPTFKCAL